MSTGTPAEVMQTTISASDREDVLEGLRSFVRSRVIPLHEKESAILDDPRRRYGADGRYSPETLDLMRHVRMESSAAGYYTMLVPESLGGGGLGPTMLYDVWEDLHHQFGPKYWLAYQAVAHWAKGPSPALRFAVPDFVAPLLPGLLSGERMMCFAMSEPDAGSDAWGMRTRATPITGGGWSITGTKQWISNGSIADYALVLAVTDNAQAAERKSGVTAFLVPTDQPGFHVDSTIKMFGQLGGHEAILSFDSVEVGAHQVVGELHRGFEVGSGQRGDGPPLQRGEVGRTGSVGTRAGDRVHNQSRGIRSAHRQEPRRHVSFGGVSDGGRGSPCARRPMRNTSRAGPRHD